MKEDVLQQIVDDYLKFKGYFTTHNVGFRPRSDHPDYIRAKTEATARFCPSPPFNVPFRAEGQRAAPAKVSLV